MKPGLPLIRSCHDSNPWPRRRADVRGPRFRAAAASQSRQAERDRDRHHARAASSSSCGPISRPNMPSVSSSSPVTAFTTTCRSIASWMASWRKPVTARTSTAPADRNIRTCKAEFSNVPFKRGVVGMARAGRSGLGEFAILHLLCRCVLPQRPIHRGRRSRLRHGCGGQAEEGAVRLGKRRGHRSRQDAEGASRLRHQVNARHGSAGHPGCDLAHPRR